MKRIFQNFSVLLILAISMVQSGCGSHNETHDATVNFEFELSNAVAKVADLRIVTDVNGKTDIFNGSKSFSKSFIGKMSEDESGTFMILSVYLTLKDNYIDEIQKMSVSELNTFYRNCTFMSDLKVDIKDNPALNLEQSDSYDGLPKDGVINAETIIHTLEKHSASSEFSEPLFVSMVR